MKQGTQILYVPDHVLRHKDVEAGFVFRPVEDGAFCRYWIKDLTQLRTIANS